MFTSGSSWLAKCMAKEASVLSVVSRTQDSTRMDWFTGSAPSSGEMVESAQANSTKLTCTEKPSTNGPTERSTLEITSMVSDADMEKCTMRMGASTEVIGSVTNQMEQEL